MGPYGQHSRALDAISGTIPPTTPRWSVDGDTVMASYAFRMADDPAADTLRSWWASRADEALTTLLRLDEARLTGVGITSQTTRALRLHPQKFGKLDAISPDGVTFPTEPAAFRAAVLSQARDLYGGRPGLRMDLARLRPGILADATPTAPDRPPHQTQMLRYLNPNALRIPLDAPVQASELRQLRHRGSAATALDELPRPLLQHLPAHGLSAASYLLQYCHTNPSCLLLTAIHLPLRKKEPAWLLRNSRPVLLQPYLRRLEATAVFQRLLHSLEASGRLPSEMFAYRPQLSAQHAGILPASWRRKKKKTNGRDYALIPQERDSEANPPPNLRGHTALAPCMALTAGSPRAIHRPPLSDTFFPPSRFAGPAQLASSHSHSDGYSPTGRPGTEASTSPTGTRVTPSATSPGRTQATS